MTARNHAYYALNGIRDELEAHLPTYIAAIEDAEEIILPEPDAYIVSKREPEHTGNPVVTVCSEGPVDEVVYISPLATADLAIPLLVQVWHRVRENDQDADTCALHYADAVAEVIAADIHYEQGDTPTGVEGLLVARNVTADFDFYGGGKHGRVSQVRADVTFRTTRAT